jgi:hypothetical protein
MDGYTANTLSELSTVLLGVGLLGVIALLALVLFVVRLRSRGGRKPGPAYPAVQDQEVERLRSQVRALAAGAAGMAEALAKVEQQVKRVGDRQQQLEQRDPAAQVYEQAMQLVRDGATVEELMSRCGLVRDEAELLLRMHRYRQTG